MQPFTGPIPSVRPSLSEFVTAFSFENTVVMGLPDGDLRRIVMICLDVFTQNWCVTDGRMDGQNMALCVWLHATDHTWSGCDETEIVKLYLTLQSRLQPKMCREQLSLFQTTLTFMFDRFTHGRCV